MERIALSSMLLQGSWAVFQVKFVHLRQNAHMYQPEVSTALSLQARVMPCHDAFTMQTGTCAACASVPATHLYAYNSDACIGLQAHTVPENPPKTTKNVPVPLSLAAGKLPGGSVVSNTCLSTKEAAASNPYARVDAQSIVYSRLSISFSFEAWELTICHWHVGLCSGAFQWAADIDTDMLDASFAGLALPHKPAPIQQAPGSAFLWMPHSLRGLLHPQGSPGGGNLLVSVMPLHLELVALAHLSCDPILLTALQSQDPSAAVVQHLHSTLKQVEASGSKSSSVCLGEGGNDLTCGWQM